MKTAEEYLKEYAKGKPISMIIGDGGGELPNNVRHIVDVMESYSQQQSKEIEKLQVWKKEQLEVYGDFMDFMQDHPDVRLGDSLTQKAIEFIRSKDEKDQLLKEMAGHLDFIFENGDVFRSAIEAHHNVDFEEWAPEAKQTLSKYKELVK